MAMISLPQQKAKDLSTRQFFRTEGGRHDKTEVLWKEIFMRGNRKMIR